MLFFFCCCFFSCSFFAAVVFFVPPRLFAGFRAPLGIGGVEAQGCFVGFDAGFQGFFFCINTPLL
jgi:hypothetical protein